MYHYTDCGLDNVYLVNGFSIEETEYGTMVSIADTDALHLAIGKDLVNSAAPLTGAEFRFLRLELDLSQRQLAAIINADEQAVRRWEKERKRHVKGPGERMMRVLYMEYCNESDIRKKIERLAELDVLVHPARRGFRKPSKSATWVPENCIAD